MNAQGQGFLMRKLVLEPKIWLRADSTHVPLPSGVNHGNHSKDQASSFWALSLPQISRGWLGLGDKRTWDAGLGPNVTFISFPWSQS